jgi:lysophospholipase L1-like esterase
MSRIEKLDKAMAHGEAAGEPMRWLSPQEAPLQVAGLAWFAAEGAYRRLPRQPRHPIRPPVDALANYTSGAQVRFRTDSRKLTLRARLAGPANMNHMPATGQCGFDCYLMTRRGWRYYATSRWPLAEASFEVTMFDFPAARQRDVTLYFPLYQGVEEVAVGVLPGATIGPPPPFADDRRVVVYGTSITQGGCANRPGMSYTNILSRRMNLEFINLGFSGNGRGDPELAHLITEIARPGCLVLDYEANAGDTLRETLEPFIAILRGAFPTTPLLVVSRPRFARERFHSDSRAKRLANRDFQRETVERLAAAGDSNISFLDGGRLLGGGDWEECTVDGSHPTDLGFWRMAKGLEPVLRRLLFGR